ncbi:MAG: hypothetical protein IPJ34_33845 [Myxococcales bacterium]|nr:hypothetical protein [Myxococcales bacterium]
MAHDFNNLLTVILANASMLDLDLEEDSPHREQVTPIVDAADQARRITQQLLAFSRRQELRPQRLSLNNLLEGSPRSSRASSGSTSTSASTSTPASET